MEYRIHVYLYSFATGPPITSTTEQRAHVNGSEIATGPFIMKTPLLSTYSQQLWVITKLLTSNNDGITNINDWKNTHTSICKLQTVIMMYWFFTDERYDKSFQISISIDGITTDHKLVPILSSETGHNRYEIKHNIFYVISFFLYESNSIYRIIIGIRMRACVRASAPFFFIIGLDIWGAKDKRAKNS